jgi:hypothetical protein
MKQNVDPLRLDLLAIRYLEATEQGDLNTIADLWAAAASDPEVEALLTELNEELTRAPIPRRRPVWMGLVAVAAAACVAALVWMATGQRGPRAEKADSTRPPAPVAVNSPPLASGPVPAVPTSHAARIAHLADDLESAKVPAFAWPFAELPIPRGSSAIPADLLN